MTPLPERIAQEVKLLSDQMLEFGGGLALNYNGS